MTRLRRSLTALLTAHPGVYDVLDALIGVALDRPLAYARRHADLDLDRGGGVTA